MSSLDPAVQMATPLSQTQEVTRSHGLFLRRGLSIPANNKHLEDGCSICLSDYDTIMPPVSIAPCGHVFHRECILPWVARHNTCPMCRALLFRLSTWKVIYTGHARTRDRIITYYLDDFRYMWQQARPSARSHMEEGIREFGIRRVLTELDDNRRPIRFRETVQHFPVVTLLRVMENVVVDGQFHRLSVEISAHTGGRQRREPMNYRSYL